MALRSLYDVLRAIDPSHFVRMHRLLAFRTGAQCGPNLHVTARAELLRHCVRENVSIGSDVTIDGVLECYERGQLKIGNHVFVGRSRIYAAHSVTIGDFALISDAVAVMDSDLHPQAVGQRRAIARKAAQGVFPDVYDGVRGAPVVIGSDVWIGYGATILKGVTVGMGAIVGAGSVVTTDIEPYSIAAGAPARRIGELPDDLRWTGS